MQPILPRRHAITGLGAAVAAVAITRAQQPATPAKTATTDHTSLHYELEFKASAERMYSAILDEKQFAAFSGLSAKIDPAVGGWFTIFGGQIEGRNVELVKNLRIVQAWRPTHWDSGIYSIVHFEFKPGGAGTRLIFDHTGFPAAERDSLDTGWNSHYWEPLRQYLN